MVVEVDDCLKGGELEVAAELLDCRLNDEGGLHWGLDSFPSGVDLNHVSWRFSWLGCPFV